MKSRVEKNGTDIKIEIEFNAQEYIEILGAVNCSSLSHEMLILFGSLSAYVTREIQQIKIEESEILEKLNNRKKA